MSVFLGEVELGIFHAEEEALSKGRWLVWGTYRTFV
jgi:hypothetical protein